MDQMADGTILSELRDLIAGRTLGDGDHETAIPSLCLIRYSSSLTPLSGVLSPSLCIAAQGQKEIVLGGEYSGPQILDQAIS
jgi:hypothetical protein